MRAGLGLAAALLLGACAGGDFETRKPWTVASWAMPVDAGVYHFRSTVTTPAECYTVREILAEDGSRPDAARLALDIVPEEGPCGVGLGEVTFVARRLAVDPHDLDLELVVLSEGEERYHEVLDLSRLARDANSGYAPFAYPMRF